MIIIHCDSTNLNHNFSLCCFSSTGYHDLRLLPYLASPSMFLTLQRPKASIIHTKTDINDTSDMKSNFRDRIMILYAVVVA